jgi:hypothetical protein
MRSIAEREAFHHQELRRPDAPLHHPPFTFDEFQLGQAQQIADVVDASLSAILRLAFILGEERW